MEDMKGFKIVHLVEDNLMICMANSYKPGGRCLAGLVPRNLRWIRPVSRASKTGAVDPDVYRVWLGRDIMPLDLIKLPLGESCSRAHQPENRFLGEGKWELVVRPAPLRMLESIFAAADREAQTKVQCREKGVIFASNEDRISYSSLVRKNAASSLQLIRPEAVCWQVKERYGGGQQLRVQFCWRGFNYDLVVTDPFWCIYLSRYPRGFYNVRARGAMAQSRLYFTVSLGEPLQGYCYKLVAGVLWVPPPPGGRLYYEDKFVVEPVPEPHDDENTLKVYF